jgi:exodeoxyribonuclease V beta subunit
LTERLQSSWGGCEHIAIQTLPSLNGEHYQAPRSKALPQSALLPQRQNHQRWWTASFSSLTRGLEAGTPHEEALLDADMDAQISAEFSSPTNTFAWQKFPAGAQYGTLLHDLLQYQAEQAWPLANAGATEQDLAWQQLLQRKADWLQLPSDAQAMLQPWLQTIVSTPLRLQVADAPTQSLGSPLVLQAVPANALWAEMEFNLPVGQLSSHELDAQIQRHVLQGLERPALQNNVLQGMLSGFMDLVLQHDGRYWVLDYKSNLLADYQAPHLSAAILTKRYEVQYVLYTLALHRLLQSRLPNYHYEQHMGGAVYLFLRGVDTPSAGVHCLRPPWALIDLLDQRFAKALL